jgi:transcriptional regulator with XRE-family HTH domain
MRENDHADNGAGNPGSVLRDLRAANGWTLAEVKDRTGLPISTLSKLENGKMGLSYDKLMKLGHGLGIDIALLLSGNRNIDHGATQLVSGRRAITRAGEAQIIDVPIYSYACHAMELLNRAIHPMLVDIKAKSLEEFGEFTRHAGEEFSYVTDGSIEFHCDLYAPVILKRGDSIYFDAGMGHAYIAAESGLCRILSVCTNIPDV